MILLLVLQRFYNGSIRVPVMDRMGFIQGYFPILSLSPFENNGAFL